MNDCAKCAHAGSVSPNSSMTSLDYRHVWPTVASPISSILLSGWLIQNSVHLGVCRVPSSWCFLLAAARDVADVTPRSQVITGRHTDCPDNLSLGYAYYKCSDSYDKAGVLESTGHSRLETRHSCNSSSFRGAGNTCQSRGIRSNGHLHAASDRQHQGIMSETP